jgi:hypothetical protein
VHMAVVGHGGVHGGVGVNDGSKSQRQAVSRLVTFLPLCVPVLTGVDSNRDVFIGNAADIQ